PAEPGLDRWRQRLLAGCAVGLLAWGNQDSGPPALGVSKGRAGAASVRRGREPHAGIQRQAAAARSDTPDERPYRPRTAINVRASVTSNNSGASAIAAAAPDASLVRTHSPAGGGTQV